MCFVPLIGSRLPLLLPFTPNDSSITVKLSADKQCLMVTGGTIVSLSNKDDGTILKWPIPANKYIKIVLGTISHLKQDILVAPSMDIIAGGFCHHGPLILPKNMVSTEIALYGNTVKNIPELTGHIANIYVLDS